jgi:hypothetical protein
MGKLPMMKIKAFAKYPIRPYSYPLGHVDRDHIHVGSVTLDRNGDGGQISQEKAKEILTDASPTGALIAITFAGEDVEIELNGV